MLAVLSFLAYGIAALVSLAIGLVTLWVLVGLFATASLSILSKMWRS